MKYAFLLAMILMATIVGSAISMATGYDPINQTGISPHVGIGSMLTLEVIMLFIKKPSGILFTNFTAWDDILWEDGRKNMGGVKGTMWYIPISNIDAFPTISATPSTLSQFVTMVGNFLLFSGKHWKKIYCTMETGSVTDEAQGEVDGQSFKHSAKIFFPGTDAEALGFAAAISNTPMVFIFEEVTGQKRVIGSDGFPARCKASVTTGEKTADRKGTTIEIWTYGDTPAPIYAGTIDDGTSGS